MVAVLVQAEEKRPPRVTKVVQRVKVEKLHLDSKEDKRHTISESESSVSPTESTRLNTHPSTSLVFNSGSILDV